MPLHQWIIQNLGMGTFTLSHVADPIGDSLSFNGVGILGFAYIGDTQLEIVATTDINLALSGGTVANLEVSPDHEFLIRLSFAFGVNLETTIEGKPCFQPFFRNTVADIYPDESKLAKNRLATTFQALADLEAMTPEDEVQSGIVTVSQKFVRENLASELAKSLKAIKDLKDIPADDTDNPGVITIKQVIVDPRKEALERLKSTIDTLDTLKNQTPPERCDDV